jgi:hypothetical protein
MKNLLFVGYNKNEVSSMESKIANFVNFIENDNKIPTSYSEYAMKLFKSTDAYFCKYRDGYSEHCLTVCFKHNIDRTEILKALRIGEIMYKINTIIVNQAFHGLLTPEIISNPKITIAMDCTKSDLLEMIKAN